MCDNFLYEELRAVRPLGEGTMHPADSIATDRAAVVRIEGWMAWRVPACHIRATPV